MFDLLVDGKIRWKISKIKILVFANNTILSKFCRALGKFREYFLSKFKVGQLCLRHPPFSHTYKIISSIQGVKY